MSEAFPSSTAPISDLLIDLLDTVLYLDKKQIMEEGGVRLHPSETHMLMCAVDGMTFTEMARRFHVSKGAVSQVFSRLAGKGVVVVEKDRARRNAARVELTPLGRALHARVVAVRRRLAEDLDGYLDRYSPTERETVARFVTDLRGYVGESLSALSTRPDPVTTPPVTTSNRPAPHPGQPAQTQTRPDHTQQHTP